MRVCSKSRYLSNLSSSLKVAFPNPNTYQSLQELISIKHPPICIDHFLPFSLAEGSRLRRNSTARYQYQNYHLPTNICVVISKSWWDPHWMSQEKGHRDHRGLNLHMDYISIRWSQPHPCGQKVKIPISRTWYYINISVPISQSLLGTYWIL